MNAIDVVLPRSADEAIAEHYYAWCYAHPLVTEPQAIFGGGLLAGVRLATAIGAELGGVMPTMRLLTELLERDR